LLRVFERDLVTGHCTRKSAGFLLRALPMMNVKVVRGTLNLTTQLLICLNNSVPLLLQNLCLNKATIDLELCLDQ